jgi:hypothetical protein
MSNRFFDTVKELNSFWLGFKFTIATLPQTGLGMNLANIGALSNNLALASVSEVTLPTADISLKEIPSLGHRKSFIPTGVTFSDLIIKAPVMVNQVLWKTFLQQVNVLDGTADWKYSKSSILLAEFDMHEKKIIGSLPIAIWVFEGCQAKSFTPAPANAQSSSMIPLDVLTLHIDAMKRLL